MNICYADVISTKHSSCYPIKDIVLGVGDMSCKEAAQFCPRNSFWHIGIFKPCFLIKFYTFCQKGEIFFKKKYYLIQKIGERNLYGLGLNLTVAFRHMTTIQCPMSVPIMWNVIYSKFYMLFSQSALLCILNDYQFNFLTVMNGFFNRENLRLHQRSWLQQNI